MSDRDKATIELNMVEAELSRLLARWGLVVVGRETSGTMGAWSVRWESVEFVVDLSRDRIGEMGWISIGSMLRRKPRSHRRGPWSLSHLRGYLDQQPDHYLFTGLREQLDWYRENEHRLLNSSLLNSDELNAWAIQASRRMFSER